MGLSDVTRWKKVIETMFGVEWMAKAKADAVAAEADVVLIDMMIPFNQFCRSQSVRSLMDLVDRIDNYIESIVCRFQNATRFVILMDESGKTPKSKAATQESRGAGFTDSEVDKLGVAAYLCSSVCRHYSHCYPAYEEIAIADVQAKEEQQARKAAENEAKGTKKKGRPPARGSKSGRPSPLNGFQAFLAKYLRTKRMRGDMNRFITLCCIDKVMRIRAEGRLAPAAAPVAAPAAALRGGRVKPAEFVIDGGICIPPPIHVDWRQYPDCYPKRVHDAKVDLNPISFSSLASMAAHRSHRTLSLGKNMDEGGDDEYEYDPPADLKTMDIDDDSQSTGPSLHEESQELEELRRISTFHDFRKIVIDTHKDTPTDTRSWVLKPSKNGRSVVEKYRGIGEADIKIIKEVEENRDKSIWVAADDSDLLPILLLSISNGKQHQELPLPYPHRPFLVLDMERDQTTTIPYTLQQGITVLGREPGGYGGGSSSSSKLATVDIAALARAVVSYFQKTFPEIEAPIETFCMILIMNGTDHFSGFPGIGPVTIFDNALHLGGYHILRNAIASFDEGDSDEDEDEEKKEKRPGPSNEPRELYFDEDALMGFVLYTYGVLMDKTNTPLKMIEIVGRMNSRDPSRTYLKKILCNVSGDPGHPVYPTFLAINDRINKKNKKKGSTTEPPLSKKQKPSPGGERDGESLAVAATSKPAINTFGFTELTLRSAVRRAIWNLNYWINGHNHLCPDPLEVEPTTGHSLYGWEVYRPTVREAGTSGPVKTQAIIVEAPLVYYYGSRC